MLFDKSANPSGSQPHIFIHKAEGSLKLRVLSRWWLIKHLPGC